MGNMKFKVGDRVRIKSLDWYNKSERNGNVYLIGWFNFIKPMADFCGKIVTIKEVQSPYNYRIFEDGGIHYYTDEMIEGLVEEETKPKYEDEVNGEYYSAPKYLVRPNGYQFVDENGNVINATKIVLEKKKPKYPKTYEECEKVLRYDSHRLDNMGVTVRGYKWELIRAFQILLICRDAYWKIAGDWKPKFNSDCLTPKYIMTVDNDRLIKSWTSQKQYILAFPTEEMRDAFYENFKSEIEICKELL